MLALRAVRQGQAFERCCSAVSKPLRDTTGRAADALMWCQSSPEIAPNGGNGWTSVGIKQIATSAPSGSSTKGNSGKDQSAPRYISVIPMPKLSPDMEQGVLVKWHKKEGDQVSTYEVIVEVHTDELTKEEGRVGKLAGTAKMLVESQEDGYLARQLVKEGSQLLKVGTPLGLLCESKDKLKEAKEFKVPTDNVYDQSKPQVRVLTWQSYLKEGPPSKGGCM